MQISMETLLAITLKIDLGTNLENLPIISPGIPSGFLMENSFTNSK